MKKPSANIEIIAPFQLESYLVINRWVLDSKIENVANIWHRSEEQYSYLEIIQPINQSVRGYVQRVYESVETLALFEERNESQVTADILNSNIDQVKIRVIHSDVEGGTIPLDDGVLLVENGKELMIASTLSTFQKKRYFSGNRSSEAQKFIGSLRLGQTEIGSFIVNIIAPIVHIKSNEKDESIDNSSLTRSVINNLSRSLTALETAIEKYNESGNIIAFEEAIANGANANLCDALIGISGELKARDFNISIKTGIAELCDQEIELSHSFNSGVIPLIEMASEYYKGNYVIHDYEVSGSVIRLDHEPEEDYGVIKVSAFVNDGPKNISIQLNTEDYWSAHSAHKSGVSISCKGDLHVTARTANLLNPIGFRIIGSTDIFD